MDRRPARRINSTHMEKIMIKQINEVTAPLSSAEIEAVSGASIYVDGVYWGEGEVGFHHWPGGVPVWNIWPDGSRTPH